MELLDLYQLRMDKCAAEQFWAMAMVASMNGFVLLHARKLLKMINFKLLGYGLAIITVLFCAYIVSRHFIYLEYDSLANRIISMKTDDASLMAPVVAGCKKKLALFSGVGFYSFITLGTGFLSVFAVFKNGSSDSKK